MNQQGVIHQLQDMFIDVLDLEIIQTVAQNCEFSLHASIEALMMLSDDVDIRKSPVCSNAPQFSNNTASSKPRPKKMKVLELPLKAKPRKEFKHEGLLPVNNFAPKSKATAGGDRTSSPTLGAIKVTYRSPHCVDSDSDADVVIEEEKEYDVAGDSVSVNLSQGAFSRLQMPSGPLCQYMPLSDIQGRGKTAPETKKTAQMPSMTAVPKLPNVITLPNALPKKHSSSHMEQQKQVKPLTVPERVQKLIKEGTRVMVLMRGAPGSGKSHLATQIIRLTMGRNCSPNNFVFSTDDFFVRTKQFIPSLLQDAHSWNQWRVRAAAEHKLSPIFVDNTNTEIWEMQPYAEIAVRNGYILELLEPSTPWRYQESQLARRNVHGVTRKQIENMLARFEKNLTGKLLLTKLKLKYSAGNRPPQPAVCAPLPPQIKQKTKTKTKPQPPAAVPPEVKPKRRKKKPKAANVQLQASQRPIQPAQNASLMDTLALFLAKKVLEEGQILDPEVADSCLSNGITIGDALLPKKQDVSETTNRPGAASTRTPHVSISSEGSAVNTCGGSSDDDSSEDESEKEVEREKDDNDAAVETQELGEWQVSDSEWLYQSDDGREEEELNGADIPEPVTNGVQCWEYILVMDDSKWMYQKHHPEVQDTGVQDNPETATEQMEGLLINLAADSTDFSGSKVDIPVEVEESAREKTSAENLLIDIFSTVEASLEGGVQELLSPVNAPAVTQSMTRQTDSDDNIASHPFSLDEFDQWLCSLPTESGIEAIHWPAPSSEKSKAMSDIVEPIREEPVKMEVTAAEDVNAKTGELCPLGLQIYPLLVSSNEEKLMPESSEENHVRETALASGIVPQTGNSTLPAEDPEVHPPVLEDTGPELAPSPGTHQPCPQPADRESNEDEYYRTACSEEGSSSGGEVVPVKENRTDLLILASCKAAPTYDFLTWVTKSNEEGPCEQRDSRHNSEEQVETKPEVCGSKEQRVPRRVIGRKLNHSSDVEVLDAETLPPEVQAWGTVPEPAVSWENKDIQQGECKSSQGPQPQRSIFASEEVMQNSLKNRLTDEVQKINLSNAGGEDSDVTGDAASRAVTDTSSNTHYKDFILISQLNRSRGTPQPMEGIRIVTGRNCNINEGFDPLKHFDRAMPVKLTLDKSSMATLEDDDFAAAVLASSQQTTTERDHNFAKLLAMFPSAPQDGMKEIFEKCNGDLNWTADLLLESELEQFAHMSPDGQDTEGPVDQRQSPQVFDVSHAEPLGPPPEAADEPRCNLRARKSWRNENGSMTHVSEEALPLEECVASSDASYSEDTLRMKKLRHGELLDMGEVTTKPRHSPPNSSQITKESALGAIGFPRTRTPSPQFGDATDIQSSSTVDKDLGSSSADLEDGEMMPFELDPGFVSQLHQMFGNPLLSLIEDVRLIVNLPVSLARQIHQYLVESQLIVLQQRHEEMERMMREDEELAQQVSLMLQMDGGTESVSQEEANDMEMALAIFKSYQVELQRMKEDPDALMDKSNLCHMFPDIDTDMLQAVLTANGNSLEKAIENINAQMQCALGKRGQTVSSPETLVKRGRYLLDQASEEQFKMGQISRAGTSELRPGVAKGEAVRSVDWVEKDYHRYRDWTVCFRKLREKHHRCGGEYSRKKMTTVATFYSKLATLYTMLMDEANARAVSCLEYINTVCQNDNTLDLHNYRVREALQAFDIFVDRHIVGLSGQGPGRRALYAITGRGAHSQDGIPRIRNAVEQRIRARGLQCGRVNDGLLRVIVCSDSALTYTLRVSDET
ncbi:hypothetical protein B7P43_G06102 [Cryptotermes secundus]|uniref:Smr domain-containing protein n=4 Tax=Cryptotermes secundus TaxID=105785 RepID=A0A2J7QQ08_9NEOP|nr:uncharacterized protein LOC111866070 isoform X2 [Cryptotermes secundus]XP_033607991.1 uncharacterized protein LOC111866070 isoform X2 [Cryptotermes secundus]PNF30667.1 hypothetical protein B7P43_G06102 [Cryptotermes secundus]